MLGSGSDASGEEKPLKLKPNRLNKAGPGLSVSVVLVITYTPQCTSIKGLMVSIRWYFWCLEGWLGGAGSYTEDR